jgi:hypothetical protein
LSIYYTISEGGHIRYGLTDLRPSVASPVVTGDVALMLNCLCFFGLKIIPLPTAGALFEKVCRPQRLVTSVPPFYDRNRLRPLSVFNLLALRLLYLTPEKLCFITYSNFSSAEGNSIFLHPS